MLSLVPQPAYVHHLGFVTQVVQQRQVIAKYCSLVNSLEEKLPALQVTRINDASFVFQSSFIFDQNLPQTAFFFDVRHPQEPGWDDWDEHGDMPATLTTCLPNPGLILGARKPPERKEMYIITRLAQCEMQMMIASRHHLRVSLTQLRLLCPDMDDSMIVLNCLGSNRSDPESDLEKL